jgi:hypothetical protein
VAKFYWVWSSLRNTCQTKNKKHWGFGWSCQKIDSNKENMWKYSRKSSYIFLLFCLALIFRFWQTIFHGICLKMLKKWICNALNLKCPNLLKKINWLVNLNLRTLETYFWKWPNNSLIFQYIFKIWALSLPKPKRQKYLIMSMYFHRFYKFDPIFWWGHPKPKCFFFLVYMYFSKKDQTQWNFVTCLLLQWCFLDWAIRLYFMSFSIKHPVF